MMATCPVCMHPVSDEFGLIECGECGAQLIVHMDGRVEASGAQILGDSEPPPVPDDTATLQTFQREDLGDLEAPEIIEPTLTALHPAVASDMESTPEQEAATVYGRSGPLEMPEQDDTFPPSPPAPKPSRAARPGPALNSTDLSDIAGFANSGSSNVNEGSLRYNLRIAGIDTSDVRNQFREAITDKKMLWDVDEILRSIQDGEVELVGMSAIKAHVLISRLRNVPVQIRWEQYAVSQS